MKTVLNTNEVAHIWANQSQKNGRNSDANFYFEGKTIYSYGGHFPIATIEGDNVFLTVRSYSNTTAKHISKVRQAITHKTKIYCYDVPTVFIEGKLHGNHSVNFDYWKKEIKNYLSEIGNPKNRVLTGRISSLLNSVNELETYCKYFGIKKISDIEIKSLLSLAKSENIVSASQKMQETINKQKESKLRQATKAHGIYINLWRNFDNDGINSLPTKTKDLCNYYADNKKSFTHLRLNTDENRLETSKGVQIPVEVAKRAYIALNGCMNGKCNELSIPVMSYTITQTTGNAIIAGCHTIPNEDIKYIANLLKW